MDKTNALNNFIFKNRKTFSSRLRDLLTWKQISLAEFGRLYTGKPKSSITHYFLNDPNATLYSIAKISVLLDIDINYFLVEEVTNLADYEILNQDIEAIWNKALMNLGANLKAYRDSNEKILLDIEVEIDIDMGDLSKIENAKKNLTIATISKIAFGAKQKLSNLLIN